MRFVPFDEPLPAKIDVEAIIQIEDGISLDQLKEIKSAFQVK